MTWPGGSPPMGPMSDGVVIPRPPGGSWCRPVPQGPPDALWRERQVADRDARRVAHGWREGGGEGEQGALASPRGAVRAGSVRVLHDRALHFEGEVHAGRDPVVDGAQVPDPALVVEDVVLHEGVTEALDRGALVLHRDLERVEGLPDIGHGDVTDEEDVDRLAVQLGLDS